MVGWDDSPGCGGCVRRAVALASAEAEVLALAEAGELGSATATASRVLHGAGFWGEGERAKGMRGARVSRVAAGVDGGNVVDSAAGGGASRARELLTRVFRFDAFRAGQEAVIERLLAGRNALAIFPTGGGKSLCYELPALLLDGLTIVISPLIALMKDQVEFLRAREIPAARLDSSLGWAELREVYEQLRANRLRLLYVSPERLGNERFLHMVGRHRIALLAIDEAHCISEWGHNFRPDYLKIARLAKTLGAERVLALTATATPDVAADIARAFEVAQGDIVHTGFYRANLELRVSPCAADERLRLLAEQMRSRPRGSTIVYVMLQRTAEEVAAYLSAEGFDAVAYHAGMDSDERDRVQDAFMASDRMVVVATIAFGMGVDKSDIRYVYHYNLPKGMESYMQEIGRAGRDGEPATCELLACADDVVALENFSYGDTPTAKAVASFLGDVLNRGEHFDVSVYSLSGAYDMRPLVVETLLAYLELDGVIHATGPFYAEFSFIPQRSSREILAEFDAERAAFLGSVLQHSKRGRKWYSIDADDVARSIGERRERIVKALGFLEERGDLVLRASGLRLGFRRADGANDVQRLATRIAERFERRERKDIGRIRGVCEWAEGDGCLTERLLAYFGESRQDCGHCSRCAGEAAEALPTSPRRRLGEREAELLCELGHEGHAALAEPRQMSRFLCGLASPATTRAKLRRHGSFGVLAASPFADVLAFVEARTGDAWSGVAR